MENKDVPLFQLGNRCAVVGRERSIWSGFADITPQKSKYENQHDNNEKYISRLEIDSGTKN